MRSPESARVLVIGESLIDALPEGEVVGGSPANVALGLGRLSVPVRLHTAIGVDARGHAIADHLEGSGVEVTPESWSLARTSVAHVALDPAGVPTYRFEIDASLAPWHHDTETVVHIGSIAAFLDPGAGDIEAFVAELPQGVTVTFDPNIRAALLDDADAAKDRFRRLCALAAVVKLSDEDAAWLYPSWSTEDVLAEIAAMGPTLVALTRGGDGATVLSHGELADICPVVVSVVDTVGAGDTFMAALIASIVDGLPGTVGDAARVGARAARAAALTVQRRGADLPWAEELSGTV